MVNSMELLLGTAARISTPATNVSNANETSESGFESELQRELDAVGEDVAKDAEKANLEVDTEEIESEVVNEDEALDTQHVQPEITPVLDQLMLLHAKNEQVNNALNQELNSTEQSNNSSPEFVDTITSLGEFVVLDTNPKQIGDTQKTAVNELTESVKDDSYNIFSSKSMEDLIFKTKLQRLYESSLGEKNQLNSIVNEAEKSDFNLLEMTSVENELLGEQQLKVDQDLVTNSSELADKIIEFKHDSTNKGEGLQIGSNISSVSDLKAMVNFDSEIVVEQQQTEVNTSTEVNSESIMNQMTQSITYGKLADGEYINVKLKPDYLGEMSINIQKSAEGSFLNIKVENDSVKKMLTEKIDELLTVLSDKFITIDKVMVTSDPQSNNNGNHFSQQLSQQQREFGNNQSNDPQQNHSRKEYMTLDAVTSKQGSDLESLYGFDGKRVSIYV